MGTEKNKINKKQNELFNQAFYLINSKDLKDDKTDFQFLFQSDIDYQTKMNFNFSALSPQSYQKAISLFSEVINSEPEHKYAFTFRGVAKQRSGQTDFNSDYLKAIELDSDYFFPYYFLGIEKAQKGLYQESVDYFTLALERYPSYAKSYYNRGAMYYKLEQFEESIGDCLKAIQLDNTLGPAYHLAIDSKLKLENTIGAIEICSQIIEVEPHIAYHYHRRSYLYSLLKKSKLAVADYKKASDIDPIKYIPISDHLSQKGTDFENAYKVGVVPEVYSILQNMYQDYKVIKQTMIIKNGLKYDIMKVKKSDGSISDVYFCYPLDLNIDFK